MSNFVNPDGSALVGGLLPSGVGEALQFDASGNLKTTVGAGGASGAVTAADGALVTIGTSTDAANANTVLGQLKQIKANQSGSNAVTAISGAFVDGAITTLGQEADAAASTDTGNVTLMALIKLLLQKTPDTLAQIKTGKAFVGTSGRNTFVAGGVVGLSLFNPVGSGKTLEVWSTRLYQNANSGDIELRLTTVDPALGTAGIVTNLSTGSATASIASVSFANSAVAQTGTILETYTSLATQPYELMTNGLILLIPPGKGIMLSDNLAANTVWGMTMKWSEF